MPQGTLPLPSITDDSANWDPAVFRRILEYLRELELITYTSNKDVLITGAPDSAGRRPRLILRADDGGYWAVNVSNTGVLSTEAVDPLSLTRAGITIA